MECKPITNPNPILSWKNSKGKEFTYPISAVDKLSLFRACAYEGKPQYAVCWSLLQRFSFIYPKFKNLNSFISSYVQPINSAWFIAGNKHLAYVSRLNKKYSGEELKKKLADAERRAKNREKFASSKVTNPDYLRIVEDIFNKTLESPGGSIIHYCASFASTKDSEEAAKQSAINFGKKRGMIVADFGQSFLPGTNWFFSIAKSSNFKLRIL